MRLSARIVLLLPDAFAPYITAERRSLGSLEMSDGNVLDSSSSPPFAAARLSTCFSLIDLKLVTENSIIMTSLLQFLFYNCSKFAKCQAKIHCKCFFDPLYRNSHTNQSR